jgi:hypothetical protein
MLLHSCHGVVVYNAIPAQTIGVIDVVVSWASSTFQPVQYAKSPEFLHDLCIYCLSSHLADLFHVTEPFARIFNTEKFHTTQTYILHRGGPLPRGRSAKMHNVLPFNMFYIILCIIYIIS